MNFKFKPFLMIAVLLLSLSNFAQVDIGTNLVGPTSSTPGSTLSYNIIVSNVGTGNVANVIVKYPAVSGFTATGLTCVSGSGTGALATCPSTSSIAQLQGTGLVIPSLPEGSSVVFTVTGTAGNTFGTIITNTSTIQYGGDTNAANDSSTIETEIFLTPCATTTYTLDVLATLARSENTAGINGGAVNLVYALSAGVAIPGIGNSFTLPVAYSDLNNQYGIDNRWQVIAQGSSNTLGRSGVMLLPRTDGVGSLYNGLPANNSTSESDLSVSNTDNVFTTKIADGNLNPIGKFDLTIGNYPSSTNFKIISQQYTNWTNGNLRPMISGWWLKAIANTQVYTTGGGSPTLPIAMQPGQKYTFRYSAFGDGSATNSYPDAARGVILGDSQNYVTYGYNDIPTINSMTPALQTVNVNETPSSITVSVTKFNTNSLPTYQWYRNNINSNTGGTLISGATSSSYSPPAPSVAGTTYYYVMIKGDGSCTTTSNTSRVSTNVCYKPGSISGNALPTNLGISSLGRAGTNNVDNWPMTRKGGWIALESKSKGMVVNRVAFSDADNNSSTPEVPIGIPPSDFIEGMMVYDTTNKCMKLYTSTDNGGSFAWYCITTQTCPEVQDFSLDCINNTVTGDTYLDPNVNFTISVPYSNGDGSSYPQQSFPSTNTTGLTAVLSAGTLSVGSGTLVFTVSGTASYGGGYVFPVSLKGKVCNIIVNVTAPAGETKSSSN